MKFGVSKSLEVVQDLGDLSVSGIQIFRGGFSVIKIMGSLGQIAKIVSSVKELVEDAPLSLPELADLDAQECAQLGSALYVQVKRVVDALKS